MYTSKKAVLVGILLSMVASGITKAELKDDGGEFRFAFCSTSSCTDTHPELQICGNFFSIETKGGQCCDPASSCVSGEGGIFVDQNGTLSIGQSSRASICAMITRSGNGTIDLPANQVFFNNCIGITNWDLDLHDPLQEVIVRADENLAQFTLDWQKTSKDFDTFCPYVISSVNACTPPTVLPCNVTGVPTVAGSVGQLLLSGSTLASPVTVRVSGGNVDELVSMSCPDACTAPTGVLIVDNNARVGLGANAALGANGLSIIANGSAFITLSGDTTINNVSSILQGPDFASGDVLSFNSSGCCRTITVTETGVLDLRSFATGTVIEFGGDLRVVLEPGAQILLNGVTLRFVDNARLVAETDPAAQEIFANGFSEDVIVTDSFRVKLIGVGTLEFDDCSRFIIEPDAVVGVETLFEVTVSTVCEFASTSTFDCDMVFTQTCEIPVTNITISVQDNAEFIIGTDCPSELGGSFQVGNTVNRPGHSVSFTLLVNGGCAEAIIRQGGFFGLNEGIVSKIGVPSNWLVDVLFNVNAITIDVANGVFVHDRIFDTDSPYSSILAIGQSLDDAAEFSLLYTSTGPGAVCGGGNVVLQSNSCVGPQNPIVRAVNGANTDTCLLVGLLASTPLLPLNGVATEDAAAFFNDITAESILILGRSQSLADIATQAVQCKRTRSSVRAGFIFMDQIVRMNVVDILGACGCLDLEQALLNCAAFVRVTDLANPAQSAFFSDLP